MIRSALDAFARASDRQWDGDRAQTVGASEIGSCARRVFFSKNSGDPVYGRARDEGSTDRWGATMRGRVYEQNVWAPALRAAYGDRLLFAGDDQRTFTSEFLSATPDGLLLDEDPGEGRENDSIVLECKTADPRTNLARAKPEHVYQVQVQIGLIRERTPYRPIRGVISYTDTSFYDEVREFEIAFDPDVFATAKARAAEIMLARSPDDLKPEGIIAGGRECEYCPFTAACGRTRANRVPGQEQTELPPDLREELEATVIKAKACADIAAQYSQEEREAKEAIRDILGRAGTKKFSTDAWSINWSPVRGRPSYDQKAIREAAEAAGLNLAPYMREGEPTDRLVITVK